MDRPKFTLVDQFGLASIRAGKSQGTRIRRFQWRFYAELEEQRARCAEDLHKAILRAATDLFKFDAWQRAVRTRWSLKPLSAAGSLNPPGGRFNVGSLASFESLPALYVARDKPTALSEALGGAAGGTRGLNALEIALASPDSVSVQSVSGDLHTVVRLDEPDRLQSFVDIVKGFSISADLQRLGREIARDVGVPSPKFLVTTVKELVRGLEAPDWRALPVQVGIPSVPQVFGRLALRAGAEAIVYRSGRGGSLCLAVFPTAFEGSPSHVSLDDEQPRKDVIMRLDRTTWRRLCK